jgi:hypothetical protein
VAKPEKSPVALRIVLPPVARSEGKRKGQRLVTCESDDRAHAGWLETGWSEGEVRERRRPVRFRKVFMAVWPEEPPDRSQSAHSSEEAG